MSTVARRGIAEVLERAVAAGDVPSVSAIAADRSGVIYEGAAGSPLAGGEAGVSVDAQYRVMSMTKIFTTTVALQLIEQGKLELDAPVERYCPEFGQVQVLEGFEGDTPRLRPPASQATVKQLLTHTTGLSYWFWNADILKWHAVTGTPNVLSGRKEIFKAPLIADPGTRFEYGINADWLGRVIETVTGATLDEAIRHGITEPLGMEETAFRVNDAQRAKLVALHQLAQDGGWARSDFELVAEPEYWGGGHGLYSTPRDFLKLQRTLLGNGTSPEGVEILEPGTVEAMFANQIGDFDFPAEIQTVEPETTHTFAAGAGLKFGYGLLLNTEDAPGRRRAFSGAWGGLFNTHFWIDRTAGITGAIYSQFLPFVTEPALVMYEEFETALYASL